MRVFDEQISAIPGATSLHPEVLRGIQRRYVNPWSEEFLDFFDETVRLLKSVYKTSGDVMVMIGPIRMAMEAVVTSLLEPMDTTAVFIVNGYWSELFSRIAIAHGIEPIVINFEWGSPIDLEIVQRELGKTTDQSIKAMFVTHVETSTGVENSIKALGRIAREKEWIFVVDAAQSLGGMEVCTDDWGVDFCISGNHKCMSSPAGLNYVAVSKRGWKAIEDRKTPINAWYSNLLTWRDIWQNREAGFFTFPSSLLFGLRAALDVFFSIGLLELYRRYDIAARAIRVGIMEMGLEVLPCTNNCPGCDSNYKYCANTVTAIKYPKGIQHKDFASTIQSKYNVTVAGTYGPYSDKAFRVGPTGLLQIQKDYVIQLLSTIALAMRSMGYISDIDQMLCSVDSVLAEI